MLRGEEKALKHEKKLRAIQKKKNAERKRCSLGCGPDETRGKEKM